MRLQNDILMYVSDVFTCAPFSESSGGSVDGMPSFCAESHQPPAQMEL